MRRLDQIMADHAEPRDSTLGFLQRLTVADLMASRPPQKLIELPADSTPVENFETLVTNRILSAPVVTADGKYIGFLDIRDFVASVIFYSKAAEQEAKIKQAKKVLEEENKRNPIFEGVGRMFEPSYTMAALETYVHSFDTKATKKPQLTTTYLCRRHPFVEVTPHTHMHDLLKKLIELDVRRVAIRSDDNKVTGIISQSDIIRYLNSHAKRFPTLFHKPVSEIENLGTSPVITIESSDTVSTAFEMMEKHNIGGLAIIDQSTGKVVTNVSTSDIKLFLHCQPGSHAKLLQTSVLEFVTQVRSRTPKTIFPVVSVQNTDTLAHVMSKLAVTSLHHLYVVDHNGFPKSVISLRDCIKVLLPWASVLCKLPVAC